MFVDIRHLTFGYGGGPPVFDDFSLGLEKGCALSVIGPSGCGKSTFLYILAGLMRVGASQVVIDGRPILRPRPRTGLVLQDHGLLPWATVRENMALGWRIRRFYGPDGKHAPRDAVGDASCPDGAVDRWLKQLGIAELADRYPLQLSRGQRQRAAIGRTLALSPDLLLLDEPFSALDAPTREELQETVLGLQKHNRLTFIIVTHDIDEAVRMGESILILRGISNRDSTCLVNDAFADPASRDEMKKRLKRLLGNRP